MMSKRSFRRTFLCGVAFGALSVTGAAWAQGADTDTEEEVEVISETPASEGEARQEKITVTGSLLGRNEYTSSSPIQVITADTATLQGLVDTAAILQSSSIASGSTQINGNFGGFVVEGGTGVNTISLRGLGAQRSLVLFNGRRLGGAGTQGQVGAVDLNVIPDAVINRIEILKDGASSIYGSDAVAGVVNVITRRQVEKPEINVTFDAPFEGGGESFGIDGAYGLNFDQGSIVLSASYEKFEPLTQGERDFLSCPQDYTFDPVTGERRDLLETRPDGLGNQGEFKCFNALSDVFDDANGGRRWVFDQSLNTFRPRLSGAAGTAETPSGNAKEASTMIIPETERISLFLTADYDFGQAEFFGDFLYNNRTTRQEDWRQFFPFMSSGNPGSIANPNNPLFGTYAATPVAFARPITLVPFDIEVDIDYYSGTAGLRGDFGNSGFLSTWDWEVAAVYSRSEGDYQTTTIPINRVTDNNAGNRPVAVNEALPGGGFQTLCPTDASAAAFANAVRDGVPTPALDYQPCTTINYFSRDFIYGDLTADQQAHLFEQDMGTTVYEQTTFSGLVRGELFNLPAGPVGIAVGAEHRQFEIDDQPGFYSSNNLQWGLSSAVNTVGEDKVTEVFGELELPVLKGQPFFEELTVNLSGRYFDYDSYGSDNVYKAGLNWQINPLFRVRATIGNSYRAPALYELYLGNSTSFAGQTNIDPCNYTDGPPDNPNIDANCAAAGLTGYIPFGSSAQVVAGGGAGVLEAETSDASTIRLIFTPTGINLSLALDYFDIAIDNQVARLGAGSILGGCYASDNFPNEPLCSLFTRETDPNSPRFQQILEVSDSFVNINSQSNRGLDLTGRYEHEFSFGDLVFDVQGTWTFEDEFLLFSGEDFEPDFINGLVGEPSFTANARLQFARGDWRYNWFTDFVGNTSNERLFGGDEFNFGSRGPGLFKYKVGTEAHFEHGASVQYSGDTWAATLGVSNIFDETPPALTTGTATRRGIVPLIGTQYDYRGRSVFARISKSF